MSGKLARFLYKTAEAPVASQNANVHCTIALIQTTQQLPKKQNKQTA
jgi:hypothetical protein